MSAPRYHLRVFRLVALVLLLPLSVARADAPAKEARSVAVLPLVVADKDLEIYSVAVARAVAVELEKRLGEKVVNVTGDKAVPKGVDIVVHGRIVEAEDDSALALEARLRRTDGGAESGAIATEPGDRTSIDKLALSLAGKLAPAVRSLRRSAAAAALVSESGPNAAPERPAPKPAQPAAPRPPAEPPLLIVPATGDALGPGVDLGAAATRNMRSLLDRMGLPWKVDAFLKAPTVPQLRAAIAKHGARGALLVDVEHVLFHWRGVLLARGRLRVTLTGRDGVPVLDSRVRTGTLVGNRGDGHAALAHLVTEQALDIAMPSLKKALVP